MREIPSSRSSFQNLFIVFYCIESLHWLVKVEHVLGVVLSTLSPTELAAINLLISEHEFPLRTGPMSLSGISPHYGGWDNILFNSIQTCMCQK